MAHRKQVFQSKVLQKLYPASSTLRKEHSPPVAVEAQAKTSAVKRKASGQDTVLGDAGKTQNASNPRPRMYTVLPPPPDYNIHTDKSVTLPQLQSVNSSEDPAGESVHGSKEEVDEQNEAEEQSRRRRRRKRKKAPLQEPGKDEAPVNESSPGQSQVPVDEGECISRNKKRKLKKKMRKKKLLSMGLVPRAAPLEFTYIKEEEEDDERGAAELSEFLRTTAEICMSDSSLHAVRTPHLSAAVDDLLASIESGNKPDSVLKQLCRLKAFVQLKDTNSLEKALMELSSNPSMSAGETAAVVSLFKYWITDVLPLQRDGETRRSTARP
ncbi:glutamate-rich protein 1 isoform X2 [Kryptolebias marmoratus]|uniref:Glutamate rich 1 n=1 Tax=Kryptolebias marmoratus TaxID=37003 RepID=A0A3Q3AQL4_KRYMA|nr:glutamate-rich protein 1 isoform X2 [Kryptolebias marmoratus]